LNGKRVLHFCINRKSMRTEFATFKPCEFFATLLSIC